MFAGVALAVSELPVGTVGRHGLQRRVYDRGGELEVRFLLADDASECCPSGRRRAADRPLGQSPRPESFPALTAWTSWETVEAGGWGAHGPEPVVVPATLGLDLGVWFSVREGVRGVAVLDERGGRSSTPWSSRPATIIRS